MNQRLIKTFIIVLIMMGTSLVTPTNEAQAHHKPPKPLPCAQWHKAMRKHGLPVKVFAPIMARESSCVPRAIGWNYHKGKTHRDCKLSHARTYRRCKAVKSYDIGLLQINSSWKSVTSKVCRYKYGKMLVLQRPSCNLKVASYLYRNGGLVHWQGTSSSFSNKTTRR